MKRIDLHVFDIIVVNVPGDVIHARHVGIVVVIVADRIRNINEEAEEDADYDGHAVDLGFSKAGNN